LLLEVELAVHVVVQIQLLLDMLMVREVVQEVFYKAVLHLHEVFHILQMLVLEVL
jgi:hypothetical protein